MSIHFEFPYPSKRMPVLARNCVATSQPLATQAGLNALQKGGNAIDAALAAAITLTVVEPTMNGIGSDAFALVWDGESLKGINGSGKSPAAWKYEDFDHLKEMPSLGWESVTVPGCVATWVSLSERFGRLKFTELFEAAIVYATEGYLLSPITARAWKRAEDRYTGFQEFEQVFLPLGKAPSAGQSWHCGDMANTLSEIAETKGESFYRGDLAKRIAETAAKDGAGLTFEDMANHESTWVDPVSIQYRGYELHEIPPNGQGLAALIALGILRNFPLCDYSPDSVESYHIQIEAMKLALADGYRYIADPDFMDVSWDALLDADYLEKRGKEIDLDRAKEHRFGTPHSDTVYLTTSDSSGMMVSFIQSTYWSFGSGIVIPGTGISMQCRAHGFSLDPKHPNCVGPSKKPFHTIIPGFLTRSGHPVMSFGVMGGPMQAQGHVQMVVRMVDYGQNPQAASDAPRWKVLSGDRIALEKGISDEIRQGLIDRGHKVILEDFTDFGGAQLIWKVDDGYCAASDHRKDGHAAGY